MSTQKIKVLIIDDSAFMRRLIGDILTSDPAIDVVDTASDPLDAKEKINMLNPDVITLDIQMPHMNGLEFLERLMMHRPIPVVMISSLTEKGAFETIRALELGAVDFVTKPMRDIERSFKQLSSEICEKIKIAAQVKVKIKYPYSNAPLLQTHLQSESYQRAIHQKLIVIGASTGGVEALSCIINALPEKSPPILIAQHMPEKFTTSFAARLDKTSHITVFEATDGQKIEPGHAYLAPGSYHLGIRRFADHFVTQLNDGPLVNGHKPSVDYLFNAVSAVVPARHVCACLLTGMGKDGANGLKKLRDLGALTYGQNEESCVVYGMPRAAKEIDAVVKELHLNEIATNIMLFCK